MTAPLCRSCGRPRSPVHDADAPGPTVRHPFTTDATTPPDRHPVRHLLIPGGHPSDARAVCGEPIGWRPGPPGEPDDDGAPWTAQTDEATCPLCRRGPGWPDVIAGRIAEITRARIADDVAHQLEDRLRSDVLTAIAERRCPDPAAAAAVVLTTAELDFSRWYA